MLTYAYFFVTQSLNAILLNIPRGIIAIIVTIIAVYSSYRTQDIGRIGALMCVFSFTGPLILHVVPKGSVRLLGVYTSTIMPAYILTIASCSCNVSGYTKRTFYNARIYIGLCIGNFVGPLMMLEYESPRFLSALKGYMIADLIAGALFVYIYWIHHRENKARQLLQNEGRLPPIFPDRDQKDLTDIEDIHYMYIA